MKKLNDEHFLMLENEFNNIQEESCAEVEKPRLRLKHKFTGVVLARPKFNVTSDLPKRKTINYLITNWIFKK